jgi:hypothetical protein
MSQLVHFFSKGQHARDTHIGASLLCGHLGGHAVAETVVLLFTAGACGFCHRNVPMGGAA